MTYEELRQAAFAYLAKAFGGDSTVQPPIVGAAITIAITPRPKDNDEDE